MEIIAHNCIFCLSMFFCSLNLIYKTPHTIPNQSGVCLGLIDENQIFYSFCCCFLFLFIMAYKVQCLCCLVMHIVCKMCKSFDRRTSICVVPATICASSPQGRQNYFYTYYSSDHKSIGFLQCQFTMLYDRA